MAKESIVQIRIDSQVKEEVEKLYMNMGTSFPEAVRVFASQSLLDHGYPFVPRTYKNTTKSIRGALREYASDTLREKESEAFRKAMVTKHA
ncbi:MAG: type II toxin-antitoxin system RelB/DinJ family antitoxin [Lachnospiraceae bacterium]|nr:type II toxin-antitoxin system RelB/DinJ family antitoxin [Lachnospiraceae bacterium]